LKDKERFKALEYDWEWTEIHRRLEHTEALLQDEHVQLADKRAEHTH
jgi:hypothetical protein